MRNSIIWLSLISVIIYGAWTFPQWNEWQDKRIELNKLEKTTKEKTESIKKLKQTQANLESTEEDTLLDQVPLTLKQELIMLDLQRIVQESGFIFDGLSFAKKQNSQVEAPELIITFSAQGKKTSIPSFLKRIEENQRFMGLRDLKFSEGELNEVPIATISASVYSFAQSDK